MYDTKLCCIMALEANEVIETERDT
jgi:hypothetical protein